MRMILSWARKLLKVNWVEGRQSTGYYKCLLASLIPYFDLYLLKYDTGSYIPPHKDSTEGREHFRMNIILRKTKGGDFSCKGPTILNVFNRIILFRPDLYEHQLSKVEQGTRYVLSLGLTKNAKR